MKSFLRDDVAVALPGWIVARVVVALAVAGTRFALDGLHRRVPAQLHDGLLSWDGHWYLHIAQRGYAHVPQTGLRFFPLYPLAARYLRFIVGGNMSLSLLLIANLAALTYAALLHRLVRRETGDRDLAARSAWLVALVPPAFVLVFGYTEALTGCLFVAALLFARRRQWWPAAACGFLAGLVRPAGVFLAVAVAVEAVRPWRGVAVREWVGRAVAVVAPAVGLGLYLVWVGAKFKKPLFPLQVQQRAFLRGGFSDPVTAVIRAGRDAIAGRFDGNSAHANGFHFFFALLFVALLVVVARRWPASYTALALVSLVAALSSQRLGSFERYSFGAFPFVLALASVTAHRRVEQAVVAISVVLMAGLTSLALLGLYAP